jgi:hypothetical protein
MTRSRAYQKHPMFVIDVEVEVDGRSSVFVNVNLGAGWCPSTNLKIENRPSTLKLDAEELVGCLAFPGIRNQGSIQIILYLETSSFFPSSAFLKSFLVRSHSLCSLHHDGPHDVSCFSTAASAQLFFW